MNKKIIFGVGLLSIVAPVKAEEKQPNIIIIYTDQQRFDTIHSLGNEQIKTPNLDRIVAQGVTCTNAYVAAPVSLASRWSLMSGMYTSSHGAYSNHHRAAEPPTTSLPEELHKYGYYTAIVGKNHSFLNKQRVDMMKGSPKPPAKPEDGRLADYVAPYEYEQDPMYKLTDYAIELIDEKHKEGEPLFMWLSYLNPHTPYMCPDPFYSMYSETKLPAPAIEPEGLKAAGKPFRQQFHQSNNNYFLPYDKQKTEDLKQTYYGMISLLDDQIGRLLEYLESNNMLDNTLIVFSSDHGDYMGDHGLYTKSPAMYDCMVRVPLMFMWGENLKSDYRVNSMVSATDIMPTILDLIEKPIPEQVQGVSLKKLLNGSKKRGSKYAFAEYGIPGQPFTAESYAELKPQLKEEGIDFTRDIPWEGNPIALAGRIRMCRNQEFKLIEEIGGTSELYDMQNDPNELVNLYNNPRYAKEQKKLHKVLDKWKREIPHVMPDTVFLGRDNVEKLKRK